MTCKDCPPGSKRPATYPGPRCATHNREVLKDRKKRAHENRVQEVYKLEPGEYDALYAYQGGRCFICGRATGKTKNLAVDHNHETGNARGLLCSTCNRKVLGHLREDIAALVRAIQYLLDPPLERMRRGELPPGT